MAVEVAVYGFAVSALYLAQLFIREFDENDTCFCVRLIWRCENTNTLKRLNGLIFLGGDEMNTSVFLSKQVGQSGAI